MTIKIKLKTVKGRYNLKKNETNPPMSHKYQKNWNVKSF